MTRYTWLGVALVSGCLLTGCVERRYIVRSNPSGALLYVNGLYEGPTPQDGYIVYYGKYNFQLAKDGYETLTVVQRYPPPWYELPGLDFIAENLIPFKLRDVRVFEYNLQPAQTMGHAEVLQNGSALRARGRAIKSPPPSPRLGVPATAPAPNAPVQQPAPLETAPEPRLTPAPASPAQPPPPPPTDAAPGRVAVQPIATSPGVSAQPASRRMDPAGN